MESCGVSLCVIAKDEEALLGDCLASASAFVDEIILVDTGSSDRTREIARGFGANVVDFRWCDNFSQARNEALRHASKDWILFLDADERLETASASCLREDIRRAEAPAIFRVAIRSPQNRAAFFRESFGHRLFSNRAGIHFERPVHEQIVESARACGAKEYRASFRIIHLGYDLDAEALSLKLERNHRLLHMSLKAHPEDSYLLFTLAQNHYQRGEVEEAVRCHEEVLSRGDLSEPLLVSCMNCLSEGLISLGRMEEARKLAVLSSRAVPLQSGAYLNLLRIHEASGADAEAADMLERLLENTRTLLLGRGVLASDTLLSVQEILLLLSSLFRRRGEEAKALQMLREAWQEDRGNTRVLHELIGLARDLGEFSLLEEALRYAGKENLSGPDAKELLAVTLIKQQRFREALDIFKELLLSSPDNRHYLGRAAQLHSALGELKEAGILMKRVEALACRSE